MQNSLDLQQIAVNEVAPDGESVVWFGKPNPIRLALTMLPIFIFAIPWTAFAVFWVYTASGSQFPPDFSNESASFFPLFGVPFVLIGFAMLCSPLFVYAKAFRMVYIVTNKTIRIVTMGRRKKVETFTSADIGKIERTEKPDGSGDLIFRYDVSYDTNRKRRTAPVGFYGIPNVRTVEQHLIKLRHTSVSAGDSA